MIQIVFRPNPTYAEFVLQAVVCMLQISGFASTTSTSTTTAAAAATVITIIATSWKNLLPMHVYILH